MTPKPMTSKFRKKTNSEKGFALLIAIFTLLLLTAIGAGMVALTNTDTSISANFRDEQTAYFAAKAGIEEARDRFRSGPTAPNTLMGNAFFATGNLALPGEAGGALYITNPNTLTGEVVTPWATSAGGNVYTDDEICSEVNNIGTPVPSCTTLPGTGGWYTSTAASAVYQPASVGTTGPLPWKWARITAKTNLTSSGTSSTGSSLNSVDGNLSDKYYRVCWNGASEVAIPRASSCALYAATPPYQPVYVITALAQTPSGSRRMVQAEAVMTNFPTVPGPLVFDGASPAFGVPNSSVFSVDGTDHSGSGNLNGPGASCPGGRPSEYALGAFGPTPAAAAAAVATLQQDGSNRPNNYTGLLNPLPPGNSNVVSAGDVTSQLGSLTTVGGLQNLQSELTLIAGNEGNTYTNSGSNPVIANPGTIANPQVNVVQGDLTLPGNWTGSGILLVTGTLTFRGAVSYNGIILAVGKGNVVKSGGGSATVDGSMLMANLYSGTPPTYGPLLPPSSAPGIPTINWSGGGSMSMNYDSCWSTAMSQSLAWRIVAMREIIR
jgi:Tfp pilus assembly protein PilX